MNLLRLNLARRRNALFGVFRVSYYFTEVRVPDPQPDSLYRRIMQAGEFKESILDVVKSWTEEGKDLKVDEVKESMRVLRKSRRPKHALQLLDWMIEEKHCELSNAELAFRLDLIARIHGLEEAEKYFETIPVDSRDFKIYSILLACYANEKFVEQAEATAEKMKEIGYGQLLTYNILLNMYSNTEQYEKMDALMQEMKEQKIGWDNYTYNARLNAYAQASDVEGMEIFLLEMESNPDLKLDWNSYAVVANGYSKSGLLEKALATMEKAETLFGMKESTGEKERDASMWDVVASGYKSKNEMEKAVEALKKAVSVSEPGWKPNKFTLASCLDYLKEKGDTKAAKELLLSIQERGSLPEIVYDRLLDYVGGDKDANSKAIDQFEDSQGQLSESSG